MNILRALTCILCLGSVIGCGNGSQVAHHSKKIRVVCTTGMVADIVKNVGGDHVHLKTLMGPGVDPHLYNAIPKDAIALREADLVFYSGLHLESQSLLNPIHAVEEERKNVHAVTRALDKKSLIPADQGRHDPHVWHNVDMWKQCAAVVAEELSTHKPEWKEDFQKNLDAYQKRLAALHTKATEDIASIPKAQRVLVTAHDAFSYFGQAYDLEVKAIQGISTEGEAGVKKINELVDFLVSRKIKAIFVESSVSDANIKSLQEGCENKGHKVVIGGELFSDALGEQGEEATYEGMIKHNVETIVNALK